ncbi:desulfoferrodoxin family protein [Candidatus Harpocratesius sp.]
MKSTYYKCENCNELYEKVFEGTACTDEKCHLDALSPKTADWKNEKHVPIVERTDKGIKVTVGSTLHPMVDDHWITMIEVISGNKQYRQYLKPGDPPVAEFPIDDADVIAREYCNKHGLWTNKA